jgi:hypothetical protein
MQTLIFSDILQPGHGKNAGAYRVATQLRNAGVTCQVVDYFSHFTLEEIYQILDRFVDTDTLWVGISTTFFFQIERNEETEFMLQEDDATMFDNLFLSVKDHASGLPFPPKVMKDIFKYIRSRNPNTKIIIGGGRAWDVQQHDSLINRVIADYYVHGYADDSVVVLSKWLLDPSNPSPKFHGHFNNIIDSNKDYDYHGFNTSQIKFLPQDLIEPGEYIPIEIARGCIFKCKFCSYPLLGKKRGDYTKTKETLQEEFIYNYEQFGTTNYMFMDETTNDSMEKAEYLHDVITGLPFKIRWGGYARVDLYYSNPEMAQIMQETGLMSHFFGIETFNKKSGTAIGKGMHPDKVKDTLINLRSQWGDDVRMTSGLIAGLPYETEQTLNELEQYLLSPECPLDSWNVHALIMPPGFGSVFGSDPSKFGYSYVEGASLYEWQNEHMTFSKALAIAYRIRKNTLRRCKPNNWNNMRLQNLGYTQEQVDQLTMYDYAKMIPELNRILVEKKNKYFKQLMNLP